MCLLDSFNLQFLLLYHFQKNQRAEHIGDWVGFRPARRNGLRYEVEDYRLENNKTIKVITTYNSFIFLEWKTNKYELSQFLICSLSNYQFPRSSSLHCFGYRCEQAPIFQKPNFWISNRYQFPSYNRYLMGLDDLVSMTTFVKLNYFISISMIHIQGHSDCQGGAFLNLYIFFNYLLFQVVHNYGHGGCGLTVFWGAAGENVDLILKTLPGAGKSKL